MHFTTLPRMGGRRFLFGFGAFMLLVVLFIGSFFWFPLRITHAAASITGNIDWSSATGKTANLQYGLNAYNGYDPAVQSNTNYQNNGAAMKAGIIRWHYGGQMGDSTSDRSGWIINPSSSGYQWDTAKINSALSTALGSSGAFRYGPVKLMDIVNWPAYLDDGKGHLRTDAYDAYANLCAQLVKIINIDGHYGFTHFEVFNELENGSGSAYDHNMAEVGRIYNKVAAAIKSVDSSVKVGGPAFARPDLTYNVDDFFSVAAANVDFTSYHSYANGDTSLSNQTVWNSTNIGTITSGMQTEYRKYSGRSISYFHDEYNISWNPPDQKMNTIVGGIFDALAMISLVNYGTDAGMAWNEGDGWYGKLDANYNPRPAAYVYQYMNEDMKGNVVSSSASDSSKVAILAVKNGNKDAFVLVNRSESDQSIQLSFNGLSSGVSDGTTVTTKQASASGGSVGSTNVGTLRSSYTLPSNTVTVLSLQDNGGSASTRAINAGGGASGNFGADANFSGGYTYGTYAGIDTSGVSNAAPQSVYQSERYGNFTYTISGLTAGANYTVRLHFAEIWWTSSGQRLFNVSLNGNQVLSNFDVYAAAGTQNKAVIKEFGATANGSGTISIQFTTVKDNAKVSGIEVIG